MVIHVVKMASRCRQLSMRFVHQGCEHSDFNQFALHKTQFSDFLMQFECIEQHIFSGISDYFRLFLTDALTPHELSCFPLSL